MLLEMAGGRLSKTDLQKLLFLSQKEAGFSYYDFIPYRFGCFSFQAQSDIELLSSFGWLEEGEGEKDIKLLAKPNSSLNNGDLTAMRQFTNRFKDYRGQKLVTYVYKHYPYYATRSEIAAKILDEASHKIIRDEEDKLKGKVKAVYTIGYEGSTFENYAN